MTGQSETQKLMSDDESVLDLVGEWVSFYRANPHRFVEDYFHAHLKKFQQIIINMMFHGNYSMYIAARGQGKSFLTAVFCCAYCILYPGVKIIIAAGARSQSINVLKKIKTDLMAGSPELASEIMDIQTSQANAFCYFHNQSTIEVVTANDKARSNRSHIIIVDEFRMVDLNVLTTVLRHFNAAPRMPGFMSKPEYANYPRERNKEIYLSSAFYKSHWSYNKMRSFFAAMMSESKKSFVCGLPYQLSVKEDLYDAGQALDEMSEADFDPIRWEMEMETVWYGDEDGSLFNFEAIERCRKIPYPWLPDEFSAKLTDKRVRIPDKQNGEKRILSLDVALMASSKRRKNDAAALYINSLVPTKTQRYLNHLVYSEVTEGEHTADQALRARKLFDEYQCDYLVIDANGAGFGVFDALVREITDPKTGEVYPPLSCCNDPEKAARCTDPHAPKVIWAINANARFNSSCALLLREGFRSGKIRLLSPDTEKEDLLSALKGYSSLSQYDQSRLSLQYLNTNLLINELINLQHDESGGIVKVYEKSGMRKDRYSSLSYNYYVACQLEAKLKNHSNNFSKSDALSCIRAPKHITKGGGSRRRSENGYARKPTERKSRI